MISGDTIRVAKVSGSAKVGAITVRLLGTDAPEPAGECGSAQSVATMLLASFTAPTDSNGDGLLDQAGGAGRIVQLQTDRSQPLYDGPRVLGYATVTVNDTAVDLGATMLQVGWSRRLTAAGRFARFASYTAAQAQAKGSSAGAWGMCGGNFHRVG